MKGLNREILRLAIPSILANITVPLVGMVDTFVAGHIQGGAGAAAFIGGISVGSTIFSLLYWNFGFLRVGTGGLTAQAFGRGDSRDCALILSRGVGLALGIALLTLALQIPFLWLAYKLVDCSDAVRELATGYFFIRIWAAPATLSLMAFRGWFVGMQDSMSSMFTDLVVNIVNIVGSIVLTLGLPFLGWNGLGFKGIAIGTVLAQYSGLLYAVSVCLLKYRKTFTGYSIKELQHALAWAKLKPFLKMNSDLMLRSVAFCGIYVGMTFIAAKYGDLMLACESILMQILMLFSFFTDGFAYAGEALTGRFIGERSLPNVRQTVKYVFGWSMAIAVLFVLIYGLGGMPIVHLMTSDSQVAESCRQFIPWLLLMPPLGCAAFTWDGIYIGATASTPMRDTMLYAMISFFAIWIIGTRLYMWSSGSPIEGAAAIHLLMGAYFAHLAARTIGLSILYRKYIRVI